jgi:prepilin-type N-terminal cleavage/methylation domain-containing protein
MRHPERGFTLLEVSLTLLASGLVVALAMDFIFRQVHAQRREVESIVRRDSSARAIEAARHWITRSSRVVPSHGALRSDPHTVLLEKSARDDKGFCLQGSDTVALCWLPDDRFTIAVVPASGSKERTRAFTPAASTGEVTFTYLDPNGFDTSDRPDRASSVQMSIGKAHAIFSLNRGVP